MQISKGSLGYHEMRWLLGNLCSLYHIPFDPKLIEQNFPPPHMSAEGKNAGGKPVDCSERLKFEESEVNKDDEPGLQRSTPEMGGKREMCLTSLVDAGVTPDRAVDDAARYAIDLVSRQATL